MSINSDNFTAKKKTLQYALKSKEKYFVQFLSNFFNQQKLKVIQSIPKKLNRTIAAIQVKGKLRLLTLKLYF